MKRLLLTALVVFLAAACNNQTASTQPAPSAQSQQPVGTVKWKTYANRKYGFQISFPDNWQQVEPIVDVPAEFYFRMTEPDDSELGKTGIQILVVKGVSGTGKEVAIGSTLAYEIQGDNGSGYGRVTYTVPNGIIYFMISADFPDNNSALIKEILSSFKVN